MFIYDAPRPNPEARVYHGANAFGDDLPSEITLSSEGGNVHGSSSSSRPPSGSFQSSELAGQTPLVPTSLSSVINRPQTTTIDPGVVSIPMPTSAPNSSIAFNPNALINSSSPTLSSSPLSSSPSAKSQSGNQDNGPWETYISRSHRIKNRKTAKASPSNSAISPVQNGVVSANQNSMFAKSSIQKKAIQSSSSPTLSPKPISPSRPAS